MEDLHVFFWRKLEEDVVTKIPAHVKNILQYVINLFAVVIVLIRKNIHCNCVVVYTQACVV